jgi:hypothetical protein
MLPTEQVEDCGVKPLGFIARGRAAVDLPNGGFDFSELGDEFAGYCTMHLGGVHNLSGAASGSGGCRDTSEGMRHVSPSALG